MTLEETLTSRENVNAELRVVLDEATGKWGIRVNRVEIKSVDPPGDIQEAMEKQMRAERDRRAAILTAEGDKQSQILTAEGEKQAAVLRGRGRKRGRDPARRGRGEGDRRPCSAPSTRASPTASCSLPVPADAAAARRGRRQQGLRHPLRVRAGLRRHRPAPDSSDGPLPPHRRGRDDGATRGEHGAEDAAAAEAAGARRAGPSGDTAASDAPG